MAHDFTQRSLRVGTRVFTSQEQYDEYLASQEEAPDEGGTSEAEPEAEALEDHTVEELREIARDLDVEGYSTMRKAELVNAVREAQEEG